ncbi:hypothetical protein HN51_018427, partial [Arachis hypogaea]
ACLDEEVMDHFESSLFLQDKDVCADNDPLAWEDIKGCRVSENYAEEVHGVDCNVDEFFGDTFYDNWDERAVDDFDDFGYMNLKEITASEFRLLHFWDRTVAFSFYQLYSKMNGFAVRKNRISRNVKNEVTQQQFVCFREGFIDPGSENDSHRRKREPKPETRCGYLAEICVHVHVKSGRSITSYFQDEHNHDMLDDILTFMLPGHRNRNDAAIDQMNLMIKSPLYALARSVANTLTREIFMLFRLMLSRACTLKVRSCTLTPSCEIYTLSRSKNPNKEWNVSHYRDRSIFKCCCFRMESFGIPCDHIVAVLVYFDAEEIPKSLLIDRWSKNARSKVWEFMEKGPFCWESMRMCRNWMLNDLCREICALASSGEAKFNELRDKFAMSY